MSTGYILRPQGGRAELLYCVGFSTGSLANAFNLVKCLESIGDLSNVRLLVDLAETFVLQLQGVRSSQLFLLQGDSSLGIKLSHCETLANGDGHLLYYDLLCPRTGAGGRIITWRLLECYL